MQCVDMGIFQNCISRHLPSVPDQYSFHKSPQKALATEYTEEDLTCITPLVRLYRRKWRKKSNCSRRWDGILASWVEHSEDKFQSWNNDEMACGTLSQLELCYFISVMRVLAWYSYTWIPKIMKICSNCNGSGRWNSGKISLQIFIQTLPRPS